MKFTTFTLAAILAAGVAFAAGTPWVGSFTGITTSNAGKITAALKKLPGVAHVSVNAKTGSVAITAKEGATLDQTAVASTVTGITGTAGTTTGTTGTTTNPSTPSPSTPETPATTK